MRLAIVCLGLAALIGCGSSETKITAPDKLLPPTQSASAGGGGAPSGGGSSNTVKDGQAAKFVP